VHDPEKHDLSAQGQLTQTHFFLLNFVMYTIHILVTFVQNMKKVKIDPPYYKVGML
jgi:hypothetical protein